MSKIPTDPEKRKAYFRALGSKGGTKTKEKGTARYGFQNKELARIAGSKGGKKSKRGKK